MKEKWKQPNKKKKNDLIIFFLFHVNINTYVKKNERN